MQEVAIITKSTASWTWIELADFRLTWTVSLSRRGLCHRPLRRKWGGTGSACALIRYRTLASVFESIAASAITTFREPEFVRMLDHVSWQSRDACWWRMTTAIIQCLCFHLVFEIINHLGVLVERIMHTSGSRWTSRRKRCRAGVQLIRCHFGCIKQLFCKKWLTIFRSSNSVSHETEGEGGRL